MGFNLKATIMWIMIMVTLGLSKLVGGCCGVMFVKVKVQNLEKSHKKLRSHASAKP